MTVYPGKNEQDISKHTNMHTDILKSLLKSFKKNPEKNEVIFLLTWHFYIFL